MNLSEAIRLGDALPQTYRIFYKIEHSQLVATCAMGGALAALEGIPLMREDDVDQHTLNRLHELFPVLNDTHNKLECPVTVACASEDDCTNADCQHPCESDDQPLFDFVIHLNDAHRWTRTQIADYLRDALNV
jgi:hypothetical protein